MTRYKQKFLLVMEDGSIIKWSGLADDSHHGLGLAIVYAKTKTGLQVWDSCNMPVFSNSKRG